MTVYVGGIYEVEFNASNVVTKKTTYYPGGAMRVDIPGGSNMLYFLLKDHLSSASTLLDTAGNVVMNGEQRYYPFGETRITSGDLKTQHLFTGQLEVGLGGIYSYGARMYSPRLGRFLSADTIVPSPANPQTLNRYAYVNNDPINATDPTGHETCYDTGVEIGSGISQADCWAWGQAKWQLGLPIDAPQSRQGFSLGKVLDKIVTFEGEWSEQQKVGVNNAILMISRTLPGWMRWIGGRQPIIFRNVGHIDDPRGILLAAAVPWENTILFGLDDIPDGLTLMGTAVHELGHFIDYRLGGCGHMWSEGGCNFGSGSPWANGVAEWSWDASAAEPNFVYTGNPNDVVNAWSLNGPSEDFANTFMWMVYDKFPATIYNPLVVNDPSFSRQQILQTTVFDKYIRTRIGH